MAFLRYGVNELMFLLVVAIMESAVSDAHECLDIMSVRVLLVAIKDCQGSYEISLLQEVRHIRELVLFLFIVFKRNDMYRFLGECLGKGFLFPLNSGTWSHHFDCI